MTTKTAKSKQRGAVWEREGKMGTYFTGKIAINGAVHRLKLYPNPYKKRPQDPDFEVFIGRDPMHRETQMIEGYEKK